MKWAIHGLYLHELTYMCDVKHSDSLKQSKMIMTWGWGRNVEEVSFKGPKFSRVSLRDFLNILLWQASKHIFYIWNLVFKVGFWGFSPPLATMYTCIKKCCEYSFRLPVGEYSLPPCHWHRATAELESYKGICTFLNSCSCHDSDVFFHLKIYIFPGMVLAYALLVSFMLL